MSASSRPTAQPPSSTYRVQLNAGFTFADAERIVPYLRQLNAGALYTSPFLTAIPGSTHGYDVTDYDDIDPAIGTDDDLLRAVGWTARNTALASSWMWCPTT